MHHVAMLPQTLNEILREEMFREWNKPDGQPIDSFAEFAKAQQPWGLGLGQHRQWVTPFQVYHICDGFGDVQMALRPVVATLLPPIGKPGEYGRGRPRVDNINSNGGGTGEEYLLRRLKGRDADKGTDFVAKWERGVYKSVRSAAIAAGIVKVKPRDSDKGRDPIDRVRMYWNRATPAQRRKIARLISEAGTGEIE